MVDDRESGRWADRRAVPADTYGRRGREGVLTEERSTEMVVMSPETGSAPEIELYARRRREAEAAAAAAESEASLAATRAAAAIADAARAAEEAEAAAVAAGLAAEAAAAAAEAEEQATAEARRQVAARRPATPSVPRPYEAAIASDATVPVPLAAPTTTPTGRAARRLEAEAAAAVTTEIVLDPRELAAVPPADRPGGSDGLTVHDDGERDTVLTAVPAPRSAPRTTPRRADRRKPVTFRDRLPARPLLVGVAVVGVLAVTGVVATVVGSSPRTTPAAVVDSAPAAPVAPEAAPSAAGAPAAGVERRSDVDMTSEKAVAYLDALREADIPTSDDGVAETEAAAVICEQLGQGADEQAMVRALPAVLPTVTTTQADNLVDIAQEFYC